MGIVISYIFQNHKAVQTPTMNELTENDVALIKRTWAIPMKNSLDSGEAILYAFFEKYPQNQQKFEAFKNIPLISLKGAPGFRTHAGRIMKVLDNSINSLGTENQNEKLLATLKPIGSSHFRRGIPKKSFNELKDVALSTLTVVCNLNEEEGEIWSKLFDNVYCVIFGTMDELAAAGK